MLAVFHHRIAAYSSVQIGTSVFYPRLDIGTAAVAHSHLEISTAVNPSFAHEIYR